MLSCYRGRSCCGDACDCHPPCFSQTGWQTQVLLSPECVLSSSAVLRASASRCPLPLVAFLSLLVASLGGLLLKGLLERQDAHCSESATKTKATRKISMLGHRRMCCKMRPLVKCNFPTVSLSFSVVAWFVCLTHGLPHPGIAALPLPVLQGLTPLIVLPAVLPYPQRKNRLHLEADQVSRDFC